MKNKNEDSTNSERIPTHCGQTECRVEWLAGEKVRFHTGPLLHTILTPLQMNNKVTQQTTTQSSSTQVVISFLVKIHNGLKLFLKSNLDSPIMISQTIFHTFSILDIAKYLKMSFDFLKFSFSEKATKNCAILLMVLTVTKYISKLFGGWCKFLYVKWNKTL